MEQNLASEEVVLDRDTLEEVGLPTETEREARRFVIRDDETAEWAVKKCKEADDEYNRLIALADAEIERLEEKKRKAELKHDADTGYLQSLLMHWWKYMELIAGLTDKCVLSRVREIRNYDLSEIKDNKFRTKMAELQQRLSLPIVRTKEQVEAIEQFEALLNNTSEE